MTSSAPENGQVARSATKRKPLALILSFAAFLLATLSFCYWVAFTLAANDTAWLLRSGQAILATGTLPAHDIFSWTLPQKPWILYQWLFEVLLGALFNACGARGLWVSALITAVVTGIIYFYLLPRQWSRLRLPLALAFLFLAFALSPTWFFVRPQLISHLMVVLFINACESFRRTKSPRSIWYLPLLTIVWANCHPLWLVGLIILGAYLIPYGLNFSPSQAGKGFPAALGILVACYLAVLVNPYGPRLILYEIYLNSANNFKLVNELTPLIVNPPMVMYPFLMYLAAASAMIVWRFRAIPLPGRIVCALGILWSLAMNKFAPVGALMTWPYLGMALASLRSETKILNAGGKNTWREIAKATRASDNYLNRKGGVRLLLAAIVVSAGCFLYRIPDWSYAITVFAYGDVPTFQYLATHGSPHRHIFNDEPTGSLMIFFNVLPVFCDGRVDFFGQEFCDQWVSCIAGETGWQDYFNKLGVDEVVISNRAGLLSELKQSNQWRLEYDSGLRSVWARK